MGLNILEHNNSTPLKTEGERYDHHQELAKELAGQYDISEESSLEGVETYLNQINSLDSTDIQPDDIDPNSADVIRNTFDAYYDNPEGVQQTDEMLCDIIDLSKRIKTLQAETETLTEKRNEIICKAWNRGATAKRPCLQRRNLSGTHLHHRRKGAMMYNLDRVSNVGVGVVAGLGWF